MDRQVVFTANAWLEVVLGPSYTASPGLVLASGGFDPFHVGHLRYLNAARRLGNRLLVVLNCDEWLIEKKGFAFMTEAERAEIVKGLKCVDEVYILHTRRSDVSEAIRLFKPDIFAKGGDRDLSSLPLAEIEACHEIGAEIITGVGGRRKVQSSSMIVQTAVDSGLRGQIAFTPTPSKKKRVTGDEPQQSCFSHGISAEPKPKEAKKWPAN